MQSLDEPTILLNAPAVGPVATAATVEERFRLMPAPPPLAGIDSGRIEIADDEKSEI